MSYTRSPQVELYDRIRAFGFDPEGATYTFAQRLAHENGWSPAYAEKVIKEYRRFAFLAVAAGHPVSPSDAVDQAWHLHLVYTRSYWDEFCGKVLRLALHHEPSRGGRAERAKFDEWYAKTLDSYRRLLRADPPADVWPAPHEKARKAERCRRVDVKRNWVVPKAWTRVTLGLLVIATVLLPPLTGAVPGPSSAHFTATLASTGSPFDLRGPDFLLFYAAMVAVAFALAWGIRRRAKHAEPVAPVAELDPYQLAYLNGGAAHAANLALTRLFARGMLRANGDATVTSLGQVIQLTDPIDRAAYDSVISHPDSRVPVSHVRSRLQPPLRKIGADLKSAGLIVRSSVAVRYCLAATLVALAAPAVGAVKVAVGISRDRPVSILVFGCVFTTFLAVYLFARPPRRTAAGDAALKRLRDRNSALQFGRSQRSLDAITLGVALFGLDVLASTALEPLYRTLRPVQTYTSHWGGGGCGGSSSSGSSGGGCGGGGCGGCGGD